jgi:hypothetical protein
MKRKVFEITDESDSDLIAEEVKDAIDCWKTDYIPSSLKVTDITNYVDEDEVDWKKARKHFDKVYNRYVGLKGMPGVNVEPTLVLGFNPLILRIESKEKLRELIEEMMAVE